LALASIHTGAGLGVWSCFAKTAEALGADLFIFPGGKLQAPQDWEYLRNPVYSLVSAENLEGLIIWSSSIRYNQFQGEFDEFHRRFFSLPLVTLAYKVPDHPCVEFDAYTGMKALVSHCIRVHGARRIAFLRGPDFHQSALSRFQGYRDALEEAGVPFADRLVTNPFNWNSGEAAAAQLFEERSLVPGRDFDTLIGSSDLMTLGALGYFARQGFHVPGNFHAGGFNNSAESWVTESPLSTVHIPYDELSSRSFRILLDLLDQEKPEEDVRLESSLIIRESCGCRGIPENLSWEKEESLFHLRGREAVRNAYEKDRRNGILNTLKCELLGTRDRSSLVSSLAKYLPAIGITRGAIILYQKENTSICAGSFFPGTVNPGQGEPFPARFLLPPDLRGQFRGGIFLVQPLFIEHQALGYVLHDVTFHDGHLFEDLRHVISYALKGIGLLEEAVQARRLAEQAEWAKNEFIRSLKKARPGAVMIIGDREFRETFREENGEDIYIDSLDLLDETLVLSPPSLILLDQVSAQAAARIRRRPLSAATPLVMISRRIEEPEVRELCGYSGILICQQAAAVSPEFRRRLGEVRRGAAILPPHTGGLVKKAILYLAGHFSSFVTRWKLADAVNLSEDYLTRIFHREMGLSPWEYLNRCRVSLAEERLRFTDDTIRQIAADAGFQDQAYFCRVFKKIRGLSPGQLRKNGSPPPISLLHLK